MLAVDFKFGWLFSLVLAIYFFKWKFSRCDRNELYIFNLKKHIQL